MHPSLASCWGSICLLWFHVSRQDFIATNIWLIFTFRYVVILNQMTGLERVIKHCQFGPNLYSI
jgi:hypothetical protein